MKGYQSVILGVAVCGCAAIMGVAKPALSLANEICAWNTPSLDVETIRRVCKISDTLTPELEKLVSSKASAQRAGALRPELNGYGEDL